MRSPFAVMATQTVQTPSLRVVDSRRRGYNGAMPAGVLLVEFTRDRPDQVLERMAELAVSHDGWVNLQPNVEPDDVPGSDLGILRIFSARGPAVPLATWHPGERTRKGIALPEVGIQHPAGSRAVPLLRGRGLDVPEGWIVLQDHSKRGLVLRLPNFDVPHHEVVEWLVAASTALCAYPLPDSWLAAIHTR
jgi:hypothetical protein